MTSQPAPIAVFGATGQQGRATVDALLRRSAAVRALVRDPGSPAAAALTSRGVDVRQMSVDDPDSLRRGFDGAASAFVMATFTGPDGIDGEVRIGTAVSTAAVEVGVPFLVYSSVGGAERDTGVPHFESKRRIEEHIESLAVPACLLRPVFFMDNFATVVKPSREAGELVLRMPMPADRALQMIAVDDIGAAAAALLVDPATAPAAIEIGTDELTGDQLASAFGAQFGAPARYEALPLDVLGDNADQQAMFAWFAGPDAYHADFTATRSLVPDAEDFATWLGRAEIEV